MAEHEIDYTSAPDRGLRVHAWTCSCGDGGEGLDSGLEARQDAEDHLDEVAQPSIAPEAVL